MTHLIFIDGEAGTTGLKILERLYGRKELTLLHIPDKQRKDVKARAEALNSADISILCLPVDASKEAVSLIIEDRVRVIDTSVAFRTHPDWVFGFPELVAGQRKKISKAHRVTNPGCYSCAAISVLRPLIQSGLILKDDAVTINAISGYSGGGKKLIDTYENTAVKDDSSLAYYHYALNLEHKHTEEIRVHSGLVNRPLFVPSVGKYAQGMIVSIPLQLWALPSQPKIRDIYEALADYYAKEKFVVVENTERANEMRDNLTPVDLNNTNQLKIYVFGNEEHNQAVVVAVLDNLGKGASGQAVQCLNLMLGLEEETGLQG